MFSVKEGRNKLKRKRWRWRWVCGPYTWSLQTYPRIRSLHPLTMYQLVRRISLEVWQSHKARYSFKPESCEICWMWVSYLKIYCHRCFFFGCGQDCVNGTQSYYFVTLPKYGVHIEYCLPRLGSGCADHFKPPTHTADPPENWSKLSVKQLRSHSVHRIIFIDYQLLSWWREWELSYDLNEVWWIFRDSSIERSD